MSLVGLATEVDFESQGRICNPAVAAASKPVYWAMLISLGSQVPLCLVSCYLLVPAFGYMIAILGITVSWQGQVGYHGIVMRRVTVPEVW